MMVKTIAALATLGAVVTAMPASAAPFTNTAPAGAAPSTNTAPAGATPSTNAAAAGAGPAIAAPDMSGTAAMRIVLERSGGFAGGSTAFAVDRSTVGGRPVLRLAGSNAFRRLRANYVPANSCCDRFTYRVTVTWRGGQRKTVSALQGADAPRVLWDVIRQTERYGVRPLNVR